MNNNDSLVDACKIALADKARQYADSFDSRMDNDPTVQALRAALKGEPVLSPAECELDKLRAFMQGIADNTMTPAGLSERINTRLQKGAKYV